MLRASIFTAFAGIAQVVRDDPHHVVARLDRLMQQVLGALAGADVAQHGGVDVPPVDLDALDGRLGGKLLARLAQPADLLTLAHQPRPAMRLPEAVHVSAMGVAEAGRQQHLEILAAHLGRRPAEDPLGALIEEDDSLLVVHRDHRVGGDGEQAREQLRRQHAIHRRASGGGSSVFHELASKVAKPPDRHWRGRFGVSGVSPTS